MKFSNIISMMLFSILTVRAGLFSFLSEENIEEGTPEGEENITEEEYAAGGENPAFYPFTSSEGSSGAPQGEVSKETPKTIPSTPSSTEKLYQEPELFGSSKKEEAPIFGYGEKKEEAPIFGSSKKEEAPMFGYGEKKEEAPMFGYGEKKEEAPMFGYGKKKEEAPMFGYGKKEEETAAPMFGYGENDDNMPSLFTME